MRVVVELSCVGVKYGDSARAALQMLVVLTEGVDGFPCALGEALIERFLLLPRQLAPFLGEREGEHVVRAGELLLHLTFYPSLRFVGLAVWTMTMSAGVGNVACLRATAACQFHLGAVGIAADLKSRERLSLARQECVTVLF